MAKVQLIIDGVEYAGDLSVVASPPPPPPPPAPSPDTRIFERLTDPYKGAIIHIKNRIIDCNGLNLIEGQRGGQSVLLENCRIYNALSVYEYGTRNTNVVFDNCEFPDWLDAHNTLRPAVMRYIVYVDAIDPNLKQYVSGRVNAVLLKSCKLGSAYREHPIRIEGASALKMTDTVVTDKFDESFKANSVLRFHGTYCEITRCSLNGYVKFGTAHLNAEDIIVEDTTFTGGIKWEGKAKRLLFKNTKFAGLPYTPPAWVQA